MDNNKQEEGHEIEVTKESEDSNWYIATTHMGYKMQLQQYGHSEEEAKERLNKLLHHNEEE
jgi:hypothetical protein